MTQPVRRYDIDSLRVIAIFLLIFYHVLVAFQPWAKELIYMIQADPTLVELWWVGGLMNIWRIPLLFCISGMGVAFAMRRRTLGALILDRSKRLMLPLLFGGLTLVPLGFLFFQQFYELPMGYWPSMGHLWFLLNIWVYALLFSPLFYLLKKYPEGKIMKGIKWLLQYPLTLYVLCIPYILEADLTNAISYSSFALTGHGWIIGAISFFLGFLFIEGGKAFWETVKAYRFLFLLIAFTLYLVRLLAYKLVSPHVFLTGFESLTWLFAVFGFGYAHLNHASERLRYLSGAVFPVYVLHYPLQYLSSFFLFPLAFPAWIKFLLVIALTLGGSFALYHGGVRRMGKLASLFGGKG